MDYHALVEHFVRTGDAARAADRAYRAGARTNLRTQAPGAYDTLLETRTWRAHEAWPKGTPDLYHDLKNPKPRAIDMATAFLQADPFFPNSGYMKAKLIRRLKRAKFTPEQKRRLQTIVIARVMGPDRKEFSSYCQLALAVRSPELEAEVARLTEHEDYGVRRRARWMMLRFASVPATHK